MFHLWEQMIEGRGLVCMLCMQAEEKISTLEEQLQSTTSKLEEEIKAKEAADARVNSLQAQIDQANESLKNATDDKARETLQYKSARVLSVWKIR